MNQRQFLMRRRHEESTQSGEPKAALVAYAPPAPERSGPPLAFLRKAQAAYMPGSAVPVAQGISAPPIVMGGLRRYAKTGELDWGSCVTGMLVVLAKMTREEPLSSQEAAMFTLINEAERVKLRAMVEAAWLELVGQVQMKFGYIPGQKLTMRHV
jgi:hypothetical protein